MNLPNHKKIISFTISQKIMNQMNSMIQTGDFSSISDVVNTSILVFLGKITEEKTNPDFDFSTLIEGMPTDNSEKEKVVVALNGYSNTELENLVQVTNKNKSFIVRMALFRFFEIYNNIEKTITRESNTGTSNDVPPEEKILVSESELETLVQRMVNNILKGGHS
jgi:Predicted transcriptional regulators containing the CopG/Arc/MetJ DNA-binding domain